jgi:hypothetical protein
MLHGRCVELVADPREQSFAVVAILAEHADLDELVGEEIDVDFVQHRGRETVLPDRDDRMEPVRLRAKGAAFGRC